MDVRLAISKDRAKWDELVALSPFGSFMQSWDWGEMQKSFGVKCQRVVVEDEGRMIAVSLVLTREMPLGRSWLYAPRGPILDANTDSEDVLRVWKGFIKELAREEGAVFLRCDPILSSPIWFNGSSWRKSDHEVQPSNTLIVDVSQSSEDLLSQMHAKTRYNIRLAERKRVEIKFSKDQKDLDSFLKLSHDVKSRGPFRFHPDKYYQAMHDVLSKSSALEYGVAEFEGKTLAVHMLMYFGGEMTYTHGASSSEQRGLMAPHLLQWESLKRARDVGARRYDFFGVAPEDADRSHSWAGITRFKEGFGGKRENYCGAYDLVFDSNLYAMFNVARRIKHLL